VILVQAAALKKTATALGITGRDNCKISFLDGHSIEAAMKKEFCNNQAKSLNAPKKGIMVCQCVVGRPEQPFCPDLHRYGVESSFYRKGAVAHLKTPYASPIGASGRIYLVGRNGVTVVLKPSNKMEVIAPDKLNEDFMASPAVVGRELYLRGQKFLYCISNR
jgi:hypothetical protein